MDLVKTKTRPWRHIYRDIGIPGTKSHGNKIPGPKNREIEIRGLNHGDIGKWRETSTSRFQD